MKNKLPVESAEFSLHNLLRETQDFASHEPVKALAIAGGAGLLISVLPTRFVAGTAAAIAAALVRPALLTLGLFKIFELACSKPQTPSHP